MIVEFVGMCDIVLHRCRLRNLVLVVLCLNNEEIHIEIARKDACKRRKPQYKNKLVIRTDEKSFAEMAKDLKEKVNPDQEQAKVKCMKKTKIRDLLLLKKS